MKHQTPNTKLQSSSKHQAPTDARDGAHIGTPPPQAADIAKRARVNVRVQVTLTGDLENFVVQKVRAGDYASPGEVVREALRDFRAKDDPAELDSRALADLLLPAVRGSHRPLTAKHFDALRARARRKPVRA